MSLAKWCMCRILLYIKYAVANNYSNDVCMDVTAERITQVCGSGMDAQVIREWPGMMSSAV